MKKTPKKTTKRKTPSRRKTIMAGKFCSECGSKLDGSHSCSTTSGRAFVVTTAHRGVFFGYAEKVDGETISLNRSRLCTYWSPAMKGFTGLASKGPDANCRIGEPVDLTLRNITAVLAVTPDAVKLWETGPWAK